MRDGTRLDAGATAELARRFSGRLLLPSDQEYEDARRVYNGLIDKRPALIARCASVSDAAAAIAFAQERGLEVSVRGGGHGVAGRAVTEGGVMIDVSPMKVMQVDPVTRTARAQAGLTWAEFNEATAAHGLATTGGVVSTTGIAGLTLGGGLGYLMGLFGMAADNLLSVELVTAVGDVVTTSAESHPDLFWAVRGAGANFGVATTLEYRLHPVTTIVGGVVAHPFSAARDFLRSFRDFTAQAPDELYTFAGLGHAPDGSGELVALAVMGYAGEADAAEAVLEPLVGFGSPLVVQVGPMPYPAINSMLDEGFPAGSLNYWKSSFVRELDDAAIDTMIEVFPACPSPMSGMVLEHFHGAATRVGVSETAVPHREEGYDFLLTSLWTDPGASDPNVTWTREVHATMGPHFLDRRYVNYLSEDDGNAPGRAVYGPNYERLAIVKAAYDPDNVFRSNQNVAPAVADRG